MSYSEKIKHVAVRGVFKDYEKSNTVDRISQ